VRVYEVAAYEGEEAVARREVEAESIAAALREAAELAHEASGDSCYTVEEVAR
jgi:hypothetical protein